MSLSDKIPVNISDFKSDFQGQRKNIYTKHKKVVFTWPMSLLTIWSKALAISCGRNRATKNTCHLKR